MTQITRDVVEHVAKLAKLKLAPSELDFYQARLAPIVDYFNQMDEISGKLPADWRADTQGDATPECRDEVKTSGSVDDLLKSAPSRVGTAFQVPKIIE